MKLKNRFLGRLRLVYYATRVFFQKEDEAEINKIRIDVIIPVIEKNLDTLPLCIQGIRHCVTNKIVNIYIVAPQTEAILNFCNEDGNLIFVDENSVLGYSVKDINFITATGENRSGWIFQQLLKLSGTIGTEKYYLICDADHILLRPHCFVTNSHKLVFYQCGATYFPYYSNINRLIGKLKVDLLSYCAHKMIFDKKTLFHLKTLIENNTGLKWDKAILESLDINESSPFSEYELYGNYVPKKEKITKLWLDIDLPDSKKMPYFDLAKKYSIKYRALTFPGFDFFLDRGLRNQIIEKS